jgi:gas vesicle protein
MTSTTKVVLGILGAAAAGVVIGLLIAPEKGSEMRGRIKKTAGNWVDQVGNLFHHAEDEVDELRNKAKDLKSTAQEKASRMKENLG